VPTDFTYVLNRPWGLALFLFVVLTPRVAVRLSDPEAFFRLGRRRLLFGYSGAVVCALACLPAASALNIRSWVEAVPVHMAQDLMLASPVMAYALAALVAWFLAAFLVAPVAAWLLSVRLANGFLLLAAVLLVSSFFAAALAFVVASARAPAAFVIASFICVAAAAAIGFALASGFPFTVRIRPSHAATLYLPKEGQ
jgi:hypothetical protein